VGLRGVWGGWWGGAGKNNTGLGLFFCFLVWGWGWGVFFGGGGGGGVGFVGVGGLGGGVGVGGGFVWWGGVFWVFFCFGFGFGVVLGGVVGWVFFLCGGGGGLGSCTSTSTAENISPPLSLHLCLLAYFLFPTESLLSFSGNSCLPLSFSVGPTGMFSFSEADFDFLD